jgi:pimeloyl-ACP methyl ester carboxylesterase
MRVPASRAFVTVLTILAGLPLADLVGRDAGASDGFVSTDVEFRNGEVALAGSLVLPDGPGPHPAIVFLHGSGPTTRAGAVSYAERYAGLGFAGIVYDKRGTGSSSGSWTSASLKDLALDAVAAIDYLKERPEIDSTRIGFWGVSQAGWVATQATEFADVAFMVIVSGGGVSPYESEMFSYRTAFEHAGLSDDDQSAGLGMIEKYFDFMATGEGREALEAGIAAADDAAWFPHARLDRILPSTEEGREIWSWVANWDPRPLMEKMTFPILLLFGEKDTETPAPLSVVRWRESLEKAGNERFTIRLFPEAGHGIRLGHHGASGERPPFAEGYHETMDGWLLALTRTR